MNEKQSRETVFDYGPIVAGCPPVSCMAGGKPFIGMVLKPAKPDDPRGVTLAAAMSAPVHPDIGVRCETVSGRR